jgi:hypothetical protein
LAPCPVTKILTADWRVTAFTSLATSVHPAATVSSTRITTSARPATSSPYAPGFAVGSPAPGVPALTLVANASSPDQVIAGLAYGQAFPPTWREYRRDRTRFMVPLLAEGAARPATLNVFISNEMPAADAPPLVMPQVSPPRDVRIGERWGYAWGWQQTPLIAWTEPEVRPAGRGLIYQVVLYEVALAPDGQGTELRPQYDAWTAETSFLPPWTNTFYWSSHVVTVTAWATDRPVASPFRVPVTAASATAVSFPFRVH